MAESLGEHTFARQLAPLRADPADDAEQVTQALAGEPLRVLEERGEWALVETGYAADEIDLFIPHQANKRILDGIVKKVGVAPEKIVITLDKHGNTSAASIPLALNDAFESHRDRLRAVRALR